MTATPPPRNGHRQWRPGSTSKPCFLPIPYSSCQSFSRSWEFSTKYSLKHKAFWTFKGCSVLQFLILISHILQLTKAMWFAAQTHWHITIYPKGLDEGSWRRKAAFLGVAVVSTFPSPLLPRHKKALTSVPSARWPVWAKDSTFSLVFVLQAWTFTIHKWDWFIRSSPSPSNEIRALVSVKCSWITNAVDIGIAKAGKEEFVHLANLLSISTGQALENKFPKENAFTVQALLFPHTEIARGSHQGSSSIEEALKQCSLLFALEGKAIIKASPRDALSLRRWTVINILSETVDLLSTPFPSLAALSEAMQQELTSLLTARLTPGTENQRRVTHPTFVSQLRPGCSLICVSLSPRFGRDGKQESIKRERTKCWAVSEIPLPGYSSSRPYTQLKPLKEVCWATEQLWKRSPHFTHPSARKIFQWKQILL